MSTAVLPKTNQMFKKLNESGLSFQWKKRSQHAIASLLTSSRFLFKVKKCSNQSFSCQDLTFRCFVASEAPSLQVLTGSLGAWISLKIYTVGGIDKKKHAEFPVSSPCTLGRVNFYHITVLVFAQRFTDKDVAQALKGTAETSPQNDAQTKRGTNKPSNQRIFEYAKVNKANCTCHCCLGPLQLSESSTSSLQVFQCHPNVFDA